MNFVGLKLRLFWFIATSAVLLCPPGAWGYAQSGPTGDNEAISNLAVRVGELVQKEKAKRVVVLDLRGPDLEAHPLGRWLADQLSAALQKDFSVVEIMDRSQTGALANVNEAFSTQKSMFDNAKRQAQTLGADVVIVGTFARIPQGIGITVVALRTDTDKWLGETNGLVPATLEVDALLSQATLSPRPGVARAGIGGTTSPTCVKCAIPRYSNAARKAKYQGDVTVDVLVNASGNVEQVQIVKTPGLGLDEETIRAVKRWKFKPALDVNGQPVAALVPIDVTFRLF